VKSLRIGDVADVHDSHIQMRTMSHFNGERASTWRSTRPWRRSSHATKVARAQMEKIEAQFPQLHFHEIDAPADYT